VVRVKTYQHLSLEEREKLYWWIGQKKSLRWCAKQLKRSHTTLSREFHHNAQYGQEYLPCLADRIASRRGERQRHHAPLKNPKIFLYVRERLRKGWSPEIIAGRLPIDLPGCSIDDETIYRYVYGKHQHKDALWKRLPLGRVHRRMKLGRRVARTPKIPEAVSIDLRPEDVKTRMVPGHWETDNMEGVRSDSSVISVTVDRTTRYTMLSKLFHRGAMEKTQRLVERLERFPPMLCQSITTDNGAENSQHKRITGTLGIPVYFCHPYHSWEKGTVENTIGRLRRYLPKGNSVDGVKRKDVFRIEQQLNSTPRKCLGFLTPYEKMNQLLRGALPVRM